MPTLIATLRTRLKITKPIAALVVLLMLLAIMLAHAKPLDIVTWLALLIVATWLFNGLTTGLSEKERNEEQEKQAKACDELPSPLERDARLQKWFDLLKLEYEKAADRYDNIYRAIWQNFSYMAVLSGGILTFGSSDFDRPLLYFLALAPLTFWFVATFLPMDHYGDQTRARLSRIEDQINCAYFPEENDPRLEHFKLFRLSKYRWRVQDAVHYFGIAVTAVCVLMAVLAGHDALSTSGGRWRTGSRKALEVEPQPFHVEMRNPETEAVRDSLALLSRRVASMDSLLRVRLRSPDQVPPTRPVKKRKG
jgi:hypothetical protein